MNRKQKIEQLIVDLGWEFDRMSSCGQESYNELCNMLGIEELKPL